MGGTEESIQSVNLSRINDANVIALRLRTEPQLQELECFLRGSRAVEAAQNPETGEVIYKEVMIGEAKANRVGVADLMLFLNSFFNQHVVMGNFKTETIYWFYLGELYERMNDMLFLNKKRWGIKTEDKPLIMGMVMQVATAYLTRLLDNEERKGMNDTTRMQSQVTTVQDRKGLGAILGG
jgi:hypothetical protein